MVAPPATAAVLLLVLLVQPLPLLCASVGTFSSEPAQYFLAPTYRATSVISTAMVDPNDVPPSCDSEIYCKGDLLHTVQMTHIFEDSKTFVDMKVRDSPEEAVRQFRQLMIDTGNNPSYEAVREFVNKTFEDGNELEEWTPEDWRDNPGLVNRIEREDYREWARKLNALWRTLGRKMKQDVHDHPNLYSLIYVPHGFVIPGGRFKELYYWDSYWIVQGLLLCDMHQTAKGVIENLLHLVKTLGFVPNGSRVYYEERSQPPLLTAMARSYYEKTQDLQFIKDNIDTLEKEFDFWLNNAMIEVKKNGKIYRLARYYFLSNGPRPESYREDYNTAAHFTEAADKERMYWELKSGAATGWDFSSRWFIDENGTNNGNLSDIKTTMIVPVDLNAFLFGAATSLQYFQTLLNQRTKAVGYATTASQLRDAVQNVLWNEEDGIWYDFDVINDKQRRYFYASNVAPLWTSCYNTDQSQYIAAKVVRYIEHSGILSYRGGTPSSLYRSGEQWDMPNCWAPLQAFIIQGLDQTGQPDAQNLAEELATRWLHANYLGFEEYNNSMFEKYDAEYIGRSGGGGEYASQAGFGWTNGLVFELLAKYNSKGGNGGPGALGGGVFGGLGQEVSNSLAHSWEQMREGARGPGGLFLGEKPHRTGHPGHPGHPGPQQAREGGPVSG